MNILRNSHRSEDGFTLAELMVVIVVMGILFAVAIPIYMNTIKQSKVTRLQADVTDSAAAASAYYKQFGYWPTSSTFTSNVAVVTSGSNDQLTFNTAPAGYDGNAYNVCIQGTLALDSSTTATYSYNLMSRKLVNGACTYVGSLAQENVTNN